MKFETDNQTLKDIEIFDSNTSEQSVFSLFDFMRSLGGRDKLRFFLNNPLTDLSEINDRNTTINFWNKIDFVSELDIDKYTLDFIEHYLSQGDYPTKLPSKVRAIEKKIHSKLYSSNEYYIIERGIDYVIYLINNIFHFSRKLENYDCPALIKKNNAFIQEIVSLPEFKDIPSLNDMPQLSAYTIALYDYIFRYTHKHIVRFFLNLIYEYDVFITVSQIALQENYSYPEMLGQDMNLIELEGVFHPFIKKPVKNDIKLSSSVGNILFLTGPNMAGKSSVLKALSLSVYLAHVGFPVPASKARISLLAGLYTTINISDDTNLGHSHFYAEVRRVKFIVERLKQKNNILIVFDELFRGTNLKDALEGSVAIILALTKIRDCFIAISTHIIEIARELMNETSILFRYMDVLSCEQSFKYTYLLKEGISDSRMGLSIIENEGIISIIESINDNTIE